MNGRQILALRYGTAIRPASDLALDADPHETGTIDYFIWAIRDQDRTIVVDTGFSPEEGGTRGRSLLAHPADMLARAGIDPAGVVDVVLTHLHYDHAGNLDAFPNARFHLQEREMAYGTGRCMCLPRMRKPFAVECVVDAVRMVFADRIVFHDGDAEIAPAISLHLIGGHSRGLQAVRAETAAGPLVLASDAAHFYRYLDDGGAFPLFADYPEVIDGYASLRALAGDSGVIVPGHDPQVLERFPRLDGGTPEILVLNGRSTG